MARGILVALLVVAFAAWWGAQPDSRQNPRKGPAPAAATPAKNQFPALDKSPAAQAKRKDLIQRLVNAGIFTKIDHPGALPRVHVGRAFYELDFDTKKSFVSVVYAYHFDGTNDDGMVRVFDGRTNKAIGYFSRLQGMHLD